MIGCKIEKYIIGSGVSSTERHRNHAISLQWRNNGHYGVSNHQPYDCLLNRLFRCRSKETSKLCVTGLCKGNSPVTGDWYGLILCVSFGHLFDCPLLCLTIIYYSVKQWNCLAYIVYRFISYIYNTVECRYTAVQYNTIFRTTLHWLLQNLNQSIKSQIIRHTSPSWANYGVYFVMIPLEIGHVISALHCAWLTVYNDYWSRVMQLMEWISLANPYTSDQNRYSRYDIGYTCISFYSLHPVLLFEPTWAWWKQTLIAHCAIGTRDGLFKFGIVMSHEHATLGPVSPLRHDAVARILANWSTAFFESCAAIG